MMMKWRREKRKMKRRRTCRRRRRVKRKIEIEYCTFLRSKGIGGRVVMKRWVRNGDWGS